MPFRTLAHQVEKLAHRMARWHVKIRSSHAFGTWTGGHVDHAGTYSTHGTRFSKLAHEQMFNSCFVIFSGGWFSKLSFTAISIVSFKSMLVKRLQTSYETKEQSLPLNSYISSQKLNESLAQCSFGITESRSSVINLARLYL